MYTMESFIAEPVSVAADGSMVPTTIVASDGFPVAATRYLTRGSSEGVVLIAPGAWFRQCTYEKFARYLASRGLEAVTWDWRGIGNSKYEAGRRDRRLSMRAWAWQDYEAMLLWGSKRAGTRPLVLVAHAFGGQPREHQLHPSAMEEGCHRRLLGPGMPRRCLGYPALAG